jgi:hypothetical protein
VDQVSALLVDIPHLIFSEVAFLRLLIGEASVEANMLDLILEVYTGEGREVCPAVLLVQSKSEAVT